MTDLDARRAVIAVLEQPGVDADLDWNADVVSGFPEFWYVTATAGGQPLIGGAAYVVHRKSGSATRVPASKPPRLNCAQIREQHADTE